MKLLIGAVGRLKDDAERLLAERYVERASAIGRAVALAPVEIREIREGRARDSTGRRQDEAERLLAVASGGAMVALDERGRGMTSAEFAALIVRMRDGGESALTFLIGGPDGHGPAVLAKARTTLALGPMTLPHGLARVVLIEQIYRAITIVTGHPYHRA